ncbi:MAG: autotransporter-associated beta strand repeat-containing protein [Verrucomicrobiae bacterium]
MKTTPFRFLAIAAIAANSLAFPAASHAANQTWAGGNATSGNWSTVDNWNGGAAPGATSGNTTTDTATFNAAISNGWGTVGTPVVIDSASQNIKSIMFTGSTGSYFIGSTNGNALLLASGGAVTLAANATGTNLTETINSSLILYGSYTFINARVDPGSALVFTGNITNAATSTLTLSGNTIGAGTGNLLSGNISDGSGVMSVSVATTLGKWTMSGTNSYSGTTTINNSGGYVVLSGTNTSNGSTTLSNGVLQLNNSNNGGLARGALDLSSGTLQALTATSGNLSNALNVANNGAISGAQNVTINGNTTFTATGKSLNSSITGGNSLTLAGNVFLGTGAGNFTSTLSGTGNTTISGNIANSASGNGTNNLTITNTGTTTLSGTNTYTGTTTLTGGTLSVSSTANLGNATNTLLFNGGTLRVTGTSMNDFGSHALSYGTNVAVGLNISDVANNFTISTAMTQGTGGLTKSGAGTLTLSGANTYTGNTTVSAGTLAYGANNTLSTGNVAVSGGTLDMGIYSDSVGIVTLSSGNITGTTGVLTGTSYSLTGNGSASAILGGAGALTKSGAGTTTTLSGNNTYSGVTTISSGTLSLGGAGALGGGGNITFTGGTLQFTASNMADYSSSIKNSTGAISIDTNGQNVTFGALASTNTVGLAKSGAGTLTLNATNAYTGTTTINAGTLQLSGAAGTIAGTSFTLNGGTFVIDNTDAAGGNNNLRIADAATFSLVGGTFNYKGSDAAATNSTETIGAITQGAGSATVTITAGGSNAAQLTAASFGHSGGYGVTLVNGLSLGFNSTAPNRFIITSAPTLSGSTNALNTGINAAAKDTKIIPYLVGEATATTGGVGTVTGTANTFLTYNATSGLRPLNLADEFASNAFTSGNNTYITGNTTVSATVGINSLIINGGDVSINDGVTLTNASGAILFSGSNSIKPSGTTGNLTFANNTEAMVTVNSGVTGTISANIIPTGGNNLTKSGLGSLILSGTNSYTGTTTVTAGTLLIGVNNSILSTNALTTGAAGTFDLNGYAQTVGQINNAGTVTNSGASQTLTIGSGSTGAGSFTSNMNVIWNQAASGSTLSGSWSNTGNLTLNANSTGTILLSGSVNNTGTITNSGTGSAITTISGTIGSNVGALIQNSATSLLVLSGNNTGWAGGLQINSGTFEYQGASGLVPLGTGAITLGSTGGGDVLFRNNSNGNSANDITVVAGTGNRTLRTLKGGTLSGNITLNNDLIVDIGGGTSGFSMNGTITGNKTITFTNTTGNATYVTAIGGISNDFTGTLQVSSGAYLQTTNIGTLLSAWQSTVNVMAGGTFDWKADSTIGGLIGGGNASSTTGKILTLAGADAYSFNGTISGNGTFIKAGTGTQTFAGSNTYTGSTTVYGGTLSLAGVGGTLADTAAVTVSGGTLDVAQSDTVGVVTLSSGTISGNGTLTGSSYVLNPGSTDVTSRGTISAAVGGTGTLAKSGTGTVMLSGSNAYTGATTITAGMLQSAKPASLSTTSNITVTNAGSTLAVNYGGVSDYAAPDIVTLLGKTTFSSNTTVLAFDTTNGNGTYGNSLAMNADLTKLGANTLTLTAANTYNGSTTIGTSGGADAGTLSLTGSGTIRNAVTVYGGTLDLTNTPQTITTLTLGGGASGSTANVTIGTGGNLTLGGTVTYSSTNNPNGATISGSGSLTLNGTRTFSVGDSTAAADLTVSTVIADGSAVSGLQKTGAGTLVLSGMNTYTGLTSIGSGGILSVSNIGNGGVASNVGASSITGTNLSIQGGTLQYVGASATTNRLIQIGANMASTLEASGTGAVSFVNTGAISLSGSNATHGLILSGTNTGNNTLTPYLSDQTGTTLSTLTKTGVGTWVLAGNNTYTGTTTVNAGTLRVNGSTAAGSAFTVESSGTLGGSGTIAGSVNIKSGGTLAPGNSPGLLTVGSLVLDGGSTTAFEIAGTTSRGGDYDAINVTVAGGLTLNGAFTINFTNGTKLGDATDINLFAYTGSHTGHFSSLVATGFSEYAGAWAQAGETFTWNSSGGQTLTFSELTGSLTIAVPEPGTWALLAIAGTLLTAIRRRRRA